MDPKQPLTLLGTQWRTAKHFAQEGNHVCAVFAAAVPLSQRFDIEWLRSADARPRNQRRGEVRPAKYRARGDPGSAARPTAHIRRVKEVLPQSGNWRAAQGDA